MNVVMVGKVWKERNKRNWKEIKWKRRKVNEMEGKKKVGQTIGQPQLSFVNE